VPVSFLTDSQAREYGRFIGEPTPDQLARYFHLDDADHGFVTLHRGDYNRLGVAIQLGSLRMLGIFLEDPGQVPASALRFAARQLSLSEPEELIAEYAQSEGRWRHGPRIRQHYGYQTYTDPGVGFRLNRFLYALCWTGSDRPSALFDRAVAWLLETKVLLPGLSVLERAVARVRTRANARLHRLLIETMTPEQRSRLDGLVAVPDGARQSPLDRLRDGPYIRSSREIGRALDRLEEIRTLTNGMPSIERLPPGKVTALARFASAAKAQAVSRLPSDRRAAAIVILDPETPDDAVRTAIFQLIDTDVLAAAVERVGDLAEPHDHTYFSELRKFNRKIAYTPGLLTGLDLGAAPAGRPLLEAIEYLRVVHSGRKRTGPPPTAFAPRQWQAQLKSADAGVTHEKFLLGFVACKRCSSLLFCVAL
jgi:hypothetical protein